MENKINKQISQNIKNLRKEAKITIDTMSDIMLVTSDEYQQIDSGDLPISAAMAVRFSAALNTSIMAIYEGIEPRCRFMSYASQITKTDFKPL